jgi:hypothetical protein
MNLDKILEDYRNDKTSINKRKVIQLSKDYCSKCYEKTKEFIEKRKCDMCRNDKYCKTCDDYVGFYDENNELKFIFCSTMHMDIFQKEYGLLSDLKMIFYLKGSCYHHDFFSVIDKNL